MNTTLSEKILFLHIPKTAGTSLRAFLEGLYPEKQCCKEWFSDSLLKLSSLELAELNLIAGHYPASILDWLPHKAFRTITFMREPIARSISHFNHLKTETAAYMHTVAADSDLATFLARDDGIFELANMQTRYLGALDIDGEYFINRNNINKVEAEAWVNGPSIEQAFQRALDFLERCDVVGVVEQMQDSMLLLAGSLGLSSQASMGYANRGKLIPPSLSDETLDRLREINQFDLKLYNEAKRILSQRVATLTPEQIDESYRQRFSALPALRSWHFTPADAAYAYGWHGRELIGDCEWARWSAVENAYIDIPRLMPAAEYIISFRAGFFTLQQLNQFRFTVNGVAIPLKSVRCDEKSETQRIFRCLIPGLVINDCKGFIRLGWEVGSLINPAHFSGESDNRLLGVYLWWCGIENPTSSTIKCKFCGKTIDENLLAASSINMLSHGDLLVCVNCNVFSTRPIGSNDVGPNGQAIFHESIFGTSPVAFDSYVHDAELLREVIRKDYPVYFGNKTSDLIFEVGAGRGSLLKALYDEGYTAIGCEYSAKLVEAGRAAYGLPDSILFQLNGWDLPSYLESKSIRPTIFVFWHVIEHIENCLALLESLIKVCADEVTFIFQTPLPVPDYVYAEHLFFPSTETYHFIAERLGLSVKLLYVIPYTRFITCVLSTKNLRQGEIYPKQLGAPGFSVIGQLIAQLDLGLQALDKVTKDQFASIVRLESQNLPERLIHENSLTLANDLSQIANGLREWLSGSERSALIQPQMQHLANENQGLRSELQEALAEIDLIKNSVPPRLSDD